MTDRLRFVIDEDAEGLRLDVYLADLDDPPLSRSQIKKQIDAGDVLLNGARPKAGASLRVGDEIVWTYAPPQPLTATPQEIPLDILYEDGHVAIVNKPAGMVVHPAPGHPDGTLVNAILHHFNRLAVTGDELRPGIVHRIDKDTSGALAVTKTLEAHRHLAALFVEHRIERAYHALAFGPGLPPEGTVSTLHGRDPSSRTKFTGRVKRGRRAITHYRITERFHHGACLVECTLETGRTHQIRMHLSELGAPILGDTLYGGKKTSSPRVIRRQALHARTLGFESVDGATVRVEAPYPADFAAALDTLRRGGHW